ncbi:putative lipid II flippase FtsW [Candidatus Bipolaricaulota bacterium]|nr:putative lipid II flippase FtsW [Candidatus Bipolaricaulota bacterium]
MTLQAMLGLEGRILVVAAFLVLAGLIFVGTASAPISTRLYGDPWAMLRRQAVAVGIGLLALLLFWRVDYHQWAAIDDILLLGSFFLTLLTLIPHLGSGGRWLAFGPLSLQPSEFGKIALLLYLSGSIVRRDRLLEHPRHGLLPHLFVLGLFGILFLLQPDFGMLFLYVALTVFLLWVGGVPTGQLLLTVLFALPLGMALLFSARYRMERLLAFLNPEAYRDTVGYQLYQALLAIGSGGAFGRGLGASRVKLFYLPAAHNDFIFAVVAEEIGFLGVSIILALYASLVILGFLVAKRAPDKLGALYALGASFLLGFQTLLNLGVVVGVVPVTGLTLPFLSYGGSSVMVSLALVGLILGVARASRVSQVAMVIPEGLA